jgi:hypothetical protein
MIFTLGDRAREDRKTLKQIFDKRTKNIGYDMQAFRDFGKAFAYYLQHGY